MVLGLNSVFYGDQATFHLRHVVADFRLKKLAKSK
jgi:hypothetical protein